MRNLSTLGLISIGGVCLFFAFESAKIVGVLDSLPAIASEPHDRDWKPLETAEADPPSPADGFQLESDPLERIVP
ncbi:MAG: hypothetical protein SVX43_14010, partial [Cyanobacteriota bacterium]|nr:hypothetical protein [Cyanobacteriota bacterium]